MERQSDYGNFAAGVDMKVFLFFLILFALSQLGWVFGIGREGRAERKIKDEKYSFKKMNQEINKKLDE